MKKITEASDLKGKRVIVRASLNLPIKDGVVANNYRLQRALPTLRYLKEHGAKIILIGHIGREPEETLKPVFTELETFLPAQWGGRIDSEEFKTRAELMSDGDLLMAENMRQHEGETKNTEAFAQLIASFGDVYVNDAFPNAHREHASMVGVAKLLPAYAGLNLMQEVENVSKVMQPERPSLFLLGGAKFETKMPLVEKYLELYDLVFVGGALANDIFKARGFEIGTSLVSDVSLAGSPLLNNPKLLTPVDVIVAGPDGVLTKKPEEVVAGDKILDCGDATIEMLREKVKESKTVLWNGPFGNYEGGFKKSTEDMAKILADADAFSVVGGGDTVAAIESLGLNDKLGFVSTGGGAMLTLLELGSTPALDLLR